VTPEADPKAGQRQSNLPSPAVAGPALLALNVYKFAVTAPQEAGRSVNARVPNPAGSCLLNISGKARSACPES